MDNKKPEETQVKDLPTNVTVPDDGAIKGGGTAKKPPVKTWPLDIEGESSNDVHHEPVSLD